MRKTLKSAGAAALAAATVVSGLSFGSAAAVAAPEPQANSAKMGTQALAPMPLAFKDGSRFYSLQLRAGGESFDQYEYAQHATEAAALAAAVRYTPEQTSDGWYRFRVSTDSCVNMTTFTLAGFPAMIPAGSCSNNDSKFKLDSNKLRAYGAGLIGEIRSYTDGIKRYHRFVTNATGWPMIGDLSPISPPSADNGGFATAGLGFPATIPATERRTVHFGASANATVSSMTNTTVTVNAPSGSKFAAGQTTLTGEYKPSGGSWASSTSLTMTGTVNAAGTQFTGRMATPGSGFELRNGHQIRWGIDVVAGSTAGSQNMSFSGAGTTNHGTFSFSGNSAVTVTAPGVGNGGLATAGVGFPTSIEKSKTGTVNFGATVNNTITSMSNTTITVDAPSGSKFVAGQTTLTGEYKPAGGSWDTSNSLTMTGTVNAAGTKFTGTMAPTGQWFNIASGGQIRWGINVTAGTTTGAQNMGFSGAGTSNHGAFTFSGNSAVTVTAPANGGFATAGVGFPKSIEATKTGTVNFGASVNSTITSMTDTTITVDAPTGSRFAAGQTTLTGEYKPVDGSWASSNSLTMTGTVNADGTKFTGTMATPGGSFALHSGHQIRWGIDVVAGTTAGSQNMAFSGAGTSNHGAFTFSGNSAVTVTEMATNPLSAEVLSIDHAKKEATLTGSATPGAQIKVDGEVIATATDAGAWVGKVTGLSVGSNSVLVEQFVGSKKIDDQRLTIVVVENGGFLAAGVGHATSITQGEEENVAFGMRADKATTLEGTTRVTATAPAGTTFPADMTKLSGAYKVAGGSWVTTPGLDVTGTVTADGRTFTGTTTAGTAFAADSEARWTGKLAAAKDAAIGTRNLGFAVTGTTTHGAFSVEGNSKITIEKNDSVDLTARGAFDEDVTTLATIFGAAQSGATVKLYDADGKVIATTTANGENEYSFDVPAPSVGGKHQFTVTQTPSGEAESAPVSVELDYGQNTGLEVTSPENGSTINDVRPTFTGTGTDGATIEIREAGVLVATTTVKDGAWSVRASSNLDYAKHDVVVTQITKGDLRTQQNLSFTIEKAQEESPLTAKVDSVDDVARTAAISGHATPGAQIQRDGTVIATADATTGAWSTTVTDLKVGQNAVTFDQFIGGVKKDSKTLDIEVKQTQFPFAVTSPENDSVVRTNDKQVTFTGTGKPGGKVSVNYDPRNIGTAFVDNNGEWKFTATMNHADYELTVYYKQNPTGAVTSQQPLHITVTNNEQNNPFVVTAPANDAVISAPDKQVTFEGTGTTGGIVTIKHGAKTVGTGTVDDNGQWKFTSTMNYADYDLTAYYKKTPTSGAVQQKLHIVVTDGAVVKPFEVTTPTDGSTVETADKQVTFRGEGAGNGLVKVLRGSRVVAEGTVGTNGQWSLTGELNYGSYDVTVFHKPVGSKTADSKVLNLTIAPPAKDFEISTPSNGATVPGGPITFTGTGKDGGLVSAFLNSKKRAEGTVQGNTWTMTTAAITTPGTHTFTIYYKANPASQIADAYPVTITIK